MFDGVIDSRQVSGRARASTSGARTRRTSERDTEVARLQEAIRQQQEYQRQQHEFFAQQQAFLQVCFSNRINLNPASSEILTYILLSQSIANSGTTRDTSTDDANATSTSPVYLATASTPAGME